MTSPNNASRRRFPSDIDDEEFACQSDVRFADTTETLQSEELASTAENYQLESEAPIIRDVTEDEKQFAGDLTEVGSPITNSENLSISGVVAAATRRSIEAPTTTSTSASSSQSQSRRQQQQLIVQSTSTSSLAPLSTTSSTSQLLVVGDQLQPATPKASHHSAEWQEEADKDDNRIDNDDAAGERRQLLRGPLYRVDSSEWPADALEDDELKGADNKGATVAAASNSDAADAAEPPLRTRFEATFSRPELQPGRLLQRFEVTYEKQPSRGASTPPVKTRASPSRRTGTKPVSARASPVSRTPPKTFSKWQRVPEPRSGSPDSRVEIQVDEQAQSAAGRGTRMGEAEDDEMVAADDTDSSVEDVDDFFEDEPLFRASGVKPSRQPGALDQPNSMGQAAREDAALFQKLLERLDDIMLAADERLNRPNIRTAARLVSMEQQKDKKDDKEKHYKPSSTAFDSRSSEDAGATASASTIIPDAQTMATASALADAAAAAKAAVLMDKRRAMMDDGTSSEVSSQEDTLTTTREGQRSAAAKARDRQDMHQASVDATDVHHTGSLHQVYSSYLAKDSSEKVKRQIGTHYLRQYYGPAEQHGEKDDTELSERKRRKRQKKTRLNEGLGYCGYLLPLVFVIIIFSAICYFSFEILLSKKLNSNYSLILFSITTSAGGLFYWYNLFASEPNLI